MAYHSKQLPSVRAIENLPHTTAPLAGVVKLKFDSVHSGVVGEITGAVIQSTVAIFDPVAPSVLLNVNVCDPLPVNVWVAHPVLVTVTPVVENHVIVATTVPVVFVEVL